MAKGVIVSYECRQCGSEIVVTQTGESLLSPIYCCGLAVTEVSSVEKKAKPKKAAKKVKKKVAKKKPAAKKKASKK